MEMTRRDLQSKLDVTCMIMYVVKDRDYFNEEYKTKKGIIGGGWGSWCTVKTDKFTREELQLDFHDEVLDEKGQVTRVKRPAVISWAPFKKVKKGRVTKQK